MKIEFEESLDATAAVQEELRNQREDKLRDLKKSSEDSQKKYEGNELRSKHNQPNETLNEEIENVIKVIDVSSITSETVMTKDLERHNMS